MRFVIIECSDVDNWLAAHFNSGKQIPLPRRPSVLQPDRETAEREALRLAKRHPGKTFVVFAAVAATVNFKAPTHTTLSGKTLFETTEARLVPVSGPIDLPF